MKNTKKQDQPDAAKAAGNAGATTPNRADPRVEDPHQKPTTGKQDPGVEDPYEKARTGTQDARVEDPYEKPAAGHPDEPDAVPDPGPRH